MCLKLLKTFTLSFFFILLFFSPVYYFSWEQNKKKKHCDQLSLLYPETPIRRQIVSVRHSVPLLMVCLTILDLLVRSRCSQGSLWKDQFFFFLWQKKVAHCLWESKEALMYVGPARVGERLREVWLCSSLATSPPYWSAWIVVFVSPSPPLPFLFTL